MEKVYSLEFIGRKSNPSTITPQYLHLMGFNFFIFEMGKSSQAWKILWFKIPSTEFDTY